MRKSLLLPKKSHEKTGNIIADDRAGTVYDYRHNNRGRIDRVSVSGQIKADYAYDALERLALRATQNMTPSGTTHFVYDLEGRLLAGKHRARRHLARICLARRPAAGGGRRISLPPVR